MHRVGVQHRLMQAPMRSVHRAAHTRDVSVAVGAEMRRLQSACRGVRDEHRHASDVAWSMAGHERVSSLLFSQDNDQQRPRRLMAFCEVLFDPAD
jgi:hypothetical protein